MKYNASLRVGKTGGYRARILDRAALVQIALGTIVQIAPFSVAEIVHRKSEALCRREGATE